MMHISTNKDDAMPTEENTTTKSPLFFNHSKRREQLIQKIRQVHLKTQKVLSKKLYRGDSVKIKHSTRPQSAPNALRLNLSPPKPERPRYRNDSDQPFFKSKQEHDKASLRAKERGWNSDPFFKTKADGTWHNAANKKSHSARF